jgi:DNA replication ATP-dependent helicase Dna2
MVTKEHQIKFYTEELKEIEFSIKKIFSATGWSLFQNGDLYVGQYRGFDQRRGNVFIDIPFGKQLHSPRLDQKLTCFTLKAGFERPSNWKDVSYSELLEERNRTEAKIVDYIPSKREGWITILVREVDIKFIDALQHNQILGLGPTVPPYEYLQNLKEFSESLNDISSLIWNKILSFQYGINKTRVPTLLTEDLDIVNTIIEEVNQSVIYIFQGPPGTGKTYQIADMVSRLVLSNNSVLITALTNKATIEVCEKPFFTRLFEENRISKLPLLIDERNKFPQLSDAKELVALKGHLMLTTFYQFSKIWSSQTQTFDYVIVEEASQAYLTTIAAASKVGKKVIVVGDPKQIIPIVTNRNYKAFLNIDQLVNGMETLSQVEEFVYARKVETRRLTLRSTQFTNCFYQNTIQCRALFGEIRQDIGQLNALAHYMHERGGPSMVLFSNKSGKIEDLMFQFLVEGIDDLSKLENSEIAVLTPYVETLIYLQQNLKSKTKSKDYLIETVDRVQGLDVDFCFYVVPKSSSFSFNLNRFNVATSRAKKCTFILVEQDFELKVNMSNEVAQYVSKLKKEFAFHYPA